MTAPPLVYSDDARLQAHPTLDQRSEHVGLTPCGPLEVALAALQQIATLQQRALDHLREAAPPLPRRERGEQHRIADHEARLVERPDQILPRAQVGPGLSAQPGVHLG